MEFKERLKECRLLRGLTQKELAEQIGVAKTTMTGYEKGNREPDVLKIKKIASALNVDCDYLLGTSDNINRSNAEEKINKVINIYKRLSPEKQLELEQYAEFLLQKETTLYDEVKRQADEFFGAADSTPYRSVK